jgi:hypothetical protein
MDMHMPRLQITLVLLLILFFQSNSLSFAAAEVKAVSEVKNGEKPFSTDWPAKRPSGDSLPVKASSNCGTGREPNHFAFWIKNYFEPDNLSRHAKAHLKLQIITKNWKNWYKLSTTSCTSADIFYIEQVIWEASPFANADNPDVPGKCSLTHKMSAEAYLTPQQLRRKRVVSSYQPLFAGTTESNRKISERNFGNEKLWLCSHFSCKALYLNEHPDVTKEIAVMHFVPLSAAQCFPTAIEQSELHSVKNLKAIEPKTVNSAQLDAFRDEWAEFLKTPANTMNRQTVLKEADRLAVKYHSLFLN